MKWLAAACFFAGLCASGRPAHAWGDEGHEAIALIAEHYLTPATRARVTLILAGDDSGLVARDIAHEATWADKYRDSDRNGTREHYQATRDWHFVDLEIHGGADLNRACYGRPQLPAGTTASAGPAEGCVVDKIEEFSAELADSHASERERRLALQYLLHLVGDLHQPLHASDDHDQGGNRKLASGPGLPENNLHHDWDTAFVERLGPNPAAIAQRLTADLSDAELREWALGTPDDWALETFAVARRHAYGMLPSPELSGHYRLTDAYVADAVAVTAEQLQKAGVRLAFMLNRCLP
jgi:S1/P1 Nuclease